MLSPKQVEAVWRLHKRKGGGYHTMREVNQLAATIVLLPKRPKMVKLPAPLPRIVIPLKVKLPCRE